MLGQIYHCINYCLISLTRLIIFKGNIFRQISDMMRPTTLRKYNDLKTDKVFFSMRFHFVAFNGCPQINFIFVLFEDLFKEKRNESDIFRNLNNF